MDEVSVMHSRSLSIFVSKTHFLPCRVLVNCGLKNAEWLENAMPLKNGDVRYRIFSADVSGNQIESLNLVLNDTMTTNNLVIMNNPLRRLRIVKGDDSTFAYMNSLITDGASEYMEIRGVTLQNSPYLYVKHAT